MTCDEIEVIACIILGVFREKIMTDILTRVVLGLFHRSVAAAIPLVFVTNVVIL